MSKKRTAVVAALAVVTLASSVFAQDWQVRPNPFGGGYNAYGPGGQTQQIRPNPFGGGYNVYGPGGEMQQIRPNPFGGGYNIYNQGSHTMPRRYYRGW
jgi:hypothetical protein